MTLSRNSTGVLAAACLALLLAACTRTIPVVDAPGTRLPAPPAFMAPVPVARLSADQDTRDALAHDRLSLKQANARLQKSRTWYQALRQTAAGK